MKAITNSVLAAAVLLALPFASEACTNAAWNGNTGAAGGTVASGPALPAGDPNKFARYSGECALRSGSNQFVTDNTPNAEATYRARGYVYTSGSGKFFSATTADGASGTEVFGLSLTGGNLVVSGATGTSPIAVTANRWYSWEAAKQSDGSFSLTVQGAGSATPATTAGTGVSGTVGSASLGMIGAGTGQILNDEFASSRSSATAIGRLCRGNAVNTDTIINIQDRIAANNEIIGQPTGSGVARGQPDINEDGVVSIQDRIQINAVISSGQGGTFCGGAN